MDWFSGTLRQTESGGWITLKTWSGISFSIACGIADKIRESEPDALFIYEPYMTSL